MTADPLDRGAFREWLAGFEPDAVVGDRGDGCDCPLAQFLVSRGSSAPSVTETSFTTDYGTLPTDWADLPLWASDFIEAIDSDLHRASPVTASEALAVLDRVGA